MAKNELKTFQKCATIEDPIDTLFTDRVALLFAKLFIKMKWSPNMVTILSALTGVVGAVFFCFPNIYLNIIGIALEILAAIFDCTDGIVARMTKKGSLFGRCLDGFCDSVVYFAIYAGVVIRLWNETIPFTNITWQYWVLIPAVICALAHKRQASVADYYQNLYMHFLKSCESRSELGTAESILKQYQEYPKFDIVKLQLKTYYTYTKEQEGFTKHTQELLKKIKDNKEIPEKIRDTYVNELTCTAKATHLLTFNLRTIVLFVLMLLNKTVWIYAFVIVILSIFCIIIKHRFEKVAKKCIAEGFSNETKV